MSPQFKVEATEFKQTDRTGWLLKLRPPQIKELGVERAPEQLSLFTDTNRPITGAHLNGIEKFLNDTGNWAMPSIILAANPNVVQKQAKNISFDTQDIKVLDGQHRIQAFSNIIHEWELAEPKDESGAITEKLEKIRAQELPVVIFEVKDNRDQRQLFAWFARNKPIEPAVREFFDESDPFGKAAKVAMEESKLLEERVTYERKTLKPNDNDFMTLNNLKDIAITIQLGIRRSPKAEDRTACWQPEIQEALQKKLVDFFDDFLPTCGPEYELLARPAELRSKILNHKSISYAMNPQVIRLIANVWARQAEAHQPLEELATHIAGLNFKRADPLNQIDNEFHLTNHKKRFKGIRDQAWETATTRIIQALRGEVQPS